MSKDDFDKTGSSTKRPRGHFLRIPDALSEKIDEECEYLSISRNAWIIMTLDQALTRTNIERNLETYAKLEGEIDSLVKLDADSSREP